MEMNSTKMAELMDQLAVNEMLYFFLASLISADALLTTKDCERSLYMLRTISDAIPETTKLTDEQKDYVRNFCEKGIPVCESDMNKLGNVN